MCTELWIMALIQGPWKGDSISPHTQAVILVSLHIPKVDLVLSVSHVLLLLCLLHIFMEYTPPVVS